jgi:hypothetical protein
MLERSFKKLQINDTRETVLDTMGKPWKDDDCGEFLGGKQANCTEEFVYAHPFAPYVPEYWIVSFDSNNKAINFFYTTSP